jgi:chromosome segregation ATPase
MSDQSNDPDYIAYNYPSDAGPSNPHTTQETNPVTEQIPNPSPENPAVSKLREAFDTARNAILEGTELAKLVGELRASVNVLNTEVGALQRDLEYLRNRNKELDEQVSEVRRQRDQAIQESNDYAAKYYNAAKELNHATEHGENQRIEIARMNEALASMHKSRDDAELRAMELEDRLKAAEGKLAEVQKMAEAVFGKVIEQPKSAEASVHSFADMPQPVEQPRDERGQFQPLPQGSQGTY